MNEDRGKQALNSDIEVSKNDIIELLDIAQKQVDEGKVITHVEVRRIIEELKKS